MFCLLWPVQVEDGVDLGGLIVKAMGEAELTHTAMWMDQGYPDGSQWAKALRGQAPLDLWRMRKLCTSRPHMVFWSVFLSKLASALIARSFNQLFEPVRMAKADIRKHEEDSHQRSA